MEPMKFDYSTKNIAIPPQQAYIKRLIEKTEHLCKRMRWKAFFFLNPDKKPDEKETYGFRSTKTPPQIPELINMEKKLTDMIKNIKFTKRRDDFQKQLSLDQNKIRSSEKLVIPADKSGNYYLTSTKEHKDLISRSINQTYKRIDERAVNNTISEAKSIAKKLELDDRIYTTAKKEAFVTLKDHKPNFPNRPTCRLINPTKSDIGKISKKILDRVNRAASDSLNINQWKSTTDVLTWFKNVSDKQEHSFIIFDVVEFYPSISQELLLAALNFASQYNCISDDEKQIIMSSKNSILFHEGKPWGKKDTANLFDITMGSYDGAECCELVGAYLLHQINTMHGNNFGLYRDDGLGVIKATPKQTEKIKKDLCTIFNKHNLKITIDANKKIVNFLDVTLNLNTGSFMPYIKPNSTPTYVHSKSNHPPEVLKNIPDAINKRLSTISSNEDMFNRAAPKYQQALEKSGYAYQLKYSQQPAITSNAHKRRRNIIWYNPPYSKNVLTNIGKIFMQIIASEFPPASKLHKIFNSNNCKISYSCMNNIKQSLMSHNKTIQSTTTEKETTKECNCRQQHTCPLDGKCLTPSVIYQATVTSADNTSTNTYVGLTEGTFKTRYANHKSSFKHSNKRLSTELSKHIWQLKDNNINFSINWKILRTASPFSNMSRKCELCLWEKFFIVYKPHLSSLNKRCEMLSKCRHATKFLLRNSVT